MEREETFIEVLRHAAACSRESWDGTDHTRPLDDAGWTQSKRLVPALTTEPLDGIRCSPALRCTQTVEALAATTGLEVVTDPRLEGMRNPPVTDAGDPWPSAAWLGARALALLSEAVRLHRGGRLVVCSHGDVLAAALAALVGRDGVPLADVALAKGAWFTLGFDAEGRCRTAERHPPVSKRP